MCHPDGEHNSEGYKPADKWQQQGLPRVRADVPPVVIGRCNPIEQDPLRGNGEGPGDRQCDGDEPACAPWAAGARRRAAVPQHRQDEAETGDDGGRIEKDSPHLQSIDYVMSRPGPREQSEDEPRAEQQHQAQPDDDSGIEDA